MATTTLARRIRRIDVTRGTKGKQFDGLVDPEMVIPYLQKEMRNKRIKARAKQQNPAKKNRRSRARRAS